LLDQSAKMPTAGGLLNKARSLLNKVVTEPAQREAHVIQATALLMVALELSAINTPLPPTNAQPNPEPKKDCPYPTHAADCDCKGAGGDR
jgi:hypothetical protein